MSCIIGIPFPSFLQIITNSHMLTHARHQRPWRNESDLFMLSHFLEEKNFLSTSVESVKSTGRRSHHDPLAALAHGDDPQVTMTWMIWGIPPFHVKMPLTNSPIHPGMWVRFGHFYEFY